MRACLLVIPLALTLVACRDKPAEDPPGTACPPGQTFDGRYCVHGPSGGMGGSGGGSGGGAGATSGGTSGSAGTGPLGGSGGGAGLGGLGEAIYQAGPTATPLDPAALAAAEPLLAPLTAQHAPGAKPIGTIGGHFTQGQVLELAFQAQPGKCYTLVGISAGSVQNLDLKLVTQAALPGIGSPVLAVDQTVAPTAIVGQQPDCYKWAFPMAAPVKLVLSVAQGQGTAVARVLEK